jgi:polar amino acid transport system substrate-binding protein
MKHAAKAILFLVTILGFSAHARGDALADIRQRGVLRWGADQEGGGPYVYPDPQNPKRIRGFEVDLMELLAKKLGVKSQFQQCEWSNLKDLLRTGGIDVIANGYELTGSRAQVMRPTVPYYIYELQLITRSDDRTIASWDDLKPSGGRRRLVGVLSGSGAETYLVNRFGESVGLRNYSGSTDAMLDVKNGNLDATVQDLPPALFYRNRFPGLHFVGAPAGRGYYVLYVRQEDAPLQEALSTGILELARGGQLRKIYERYGIWNAIQGQLSTNGLGGEIAEEASNTDTPRGVEQSMDVRGGKLFRRNLPILLQAAGVTALLSCVAMPLAIGLGLLLALARLYGPAILSALVTAYVEVLRGTPLMLQLYTIYYVLPPTLGFHLNPFPAAILGLALNYSAYESEIYRAGLQAVPTGQMEAALALGMSRWTALRRIIIPQAVRLVIPPVTNDFIAMFKDTSICSVITVVELTKQYYMLVNNTNAYLELAAVTALLYLVMSYPLSLLARRLEQRTRPAV